MLSSITCRRVKFVLLSIISANVQYVGGKDGETETPLISLYRLR